MASDDAPQPKEQAEEPPLEPVPAVARGLRARLLSGRLGRLRWPILCLFQLGLLLGVMSFTSRSTAPESEGREGRVNADTVVPTGSHKPQPEAPLPSVPGGDMGRADALVREGRYESALAIYQPLTLGAAASLRDVLNYRLALCQEGMGRWDQALATYRTLSGRGPVSRAATAAQLGQARTWIRLKRPAEAKDLLYDLMLRSADPNLREHVIVDATRASRSSQALLADARYLLALALTLEAGRPGRPSPLNDSLASHTATDWAVERLLDAAAPTQERAPAVMESPQDVLMVQRLRSGAEDNLVRASIRRAPVSEVINQLADKCGLKPRWTARAEHLAAGRTCTLQIDNLPLPDVLRALADPPGLLWKIEADKLELSAEQEADREALIAYRVSVARRGLRDAILKYPGNPMTPAAYLELGNIETGANRLKEAIAWYERLIRELPRSPVVIEAYYNLGVSEHRIGDFDAARKAFYQVADRAPGHELAPLAYLRVGQLYLEQYDPEHALVPLRRAVAVSTGSQVQGASIVTLAAASLMLDNPRAAMATLLQNRSGVNREPYRTMASFLDSLARCRVTKDRKELRRESSVLLGALLAVQEGRALGPVGKLLVGQAYRELGMSEQMAAVYEKALHDLRGPIAAEMTYSLADYWLTIDKKPAAVGLLASLAGSRDRRWAPRARLRLAEIALEEKQPEQCLLWCRQLLREPNPKELPAIWRLMGRACEQKGDHARAASYYRGEMPP
jgi:TolA-binding protein